MESTGVIRMDDVRLTEKIGTGTYGKVWKGYFMGMGIAVKVIRICQKKLSGNIVFCMSIKKKIFAGKFMMTSSWRKNELFIYIFLLKVLRDMPEAKQLEEFKNEVELLR